MWSSSSYVPAFRAGYFESNIVSGNKPKGELPFKGSCIRGLRVYYFLRAHPDRSLAWTRHVFIPEEKLSPNLCCTIRTRSAGITSSLIRLHAGLVHQTIAYFIPSIHSSLTVLKFYLRTCCHTDCESVTLFHVRPLKFRSWPKQRRLEHVKYADISCSCGHNITPSP